MIPLRIGARGSALSVTQTTWVADQIRARGIAVEIKTIKTTGDKILDVPLAKIGGKGLFVKEIEEALLNGEIDLAVHSMKDMPTKIPEGLHIGAVPKRENPQDAL
ncbi:MAG: hydroxymethylbilane synthase, partial [Nitrospirota bacterium]